MTSPGTAIQGHRRRPESPPEFQKLHTALLAVAIFFFAYLIIEAIVLFPYMILKHGWW